MWTRKEQVASGVWQVGLLSRPPFLGRGAGLFFYLLLQLFCFSLYLFGDLKRDFRPSHVA